MNKIDLLAEVTSPTGRVDKRSIKKAIDKYHLHKHISETKRLDIVEAFYWFINDITEHPHPCKICGADTQFFGFKHLYRLNFCGLSCAAIDSVQKSKITNMARYGVPHQMHRQEVKDKVIETHMQRNGTKGYLGSDAAKKRFNELFGVEFISQTASWKQQTRETVLTRYGAMHVDPTSPINEKARHTLSVELGINWPNEYSFQQLAAWKSSVKTLNAFAQSNGFSILNIDIENSEVEAVHKCENITRSKIGKLRCFNCYPKKSSRFENSVADFLNGLGISYKKNDRQLIKPLELDFYINSHQVAIECNGDYWHSFSQPESTADKNKHLYKLEQCGAAGIKLIQISEYVWNNKNEFAKSLITNILGLNTKITSDEIRDISKQTADEFFKTNSSLDTFKYKCATGLYLNNKLVEACYKCGNTLQIVTAIGYEPQYVSLLNNEKCGKLLINKMHYQAPPLKHTSSKPTSSWYFDNLYYKRSELCKLLRCNTDKELFSMNANRLWDCGFYIVIV